MRVVGWQGYATLPCGQDGGEGVCAVGAGLGAGEEGEGYVD